MKTAAPLSPEILRVKVKTKLADLVEMFSALAEALHDSVDECYVFDYEEKKRSEDTDIREPIDVTTSSGSLVGLGKAMSAYKDYYAHPDTHTKISFRRPGFICVKDPLLFDSVMSHIAEINAVKQELSELFKYQFENHRQAELFWVTHFPHLKKEQVTRLIKLFRIKGDSRLNFCWADKVNSDKTSHEAVRGMIASRRERLKASLSSGAEQKLLACDILEQTINTLSSKAELRFRRPIRTQPYLRIRGKHAVIHQHTLQGLKLMQRVDMPCQTPVIILAESVPSFTPLETYKPKPVVVGGDNYQLLDAFTNLYLKLL